jgi:DNA polymerase III subunit chi
MPQVDFYVLSDSAPDAHLRHACRLAEQAADQGQKVFMRTTNADDVKRIDDLLWTFGDRSFLPHEIATPTSPSHPRIRVLIGGAPPSNFRDLVVNLSVDALSDDSLTRIVELVPADSERKRVARERFKNYRERGIEPTTHNV